MKSKAEESDALPFCFVIGRDLNRYIYLDCMKTYGINNVLFPSAPSRRGFLVRIL